jgi:hypothetical protein
VSESIQELVEKRRETVSILDFVRIKVKGIRLLLADPQGMRYRDLRAAAADCASNLETEHPRTNPEVNSDNLPNLPGLFVWEIRSEQFPGPAASLRRECALMHHVM